MTTPLDADIRHPAEPGARGEQARLIAEREAADRRYNEKLTAVDAAIGRTPSVPPTPSTRDDGRVEALEALGAIVPAAMPAGAGGWRGWLRTFVWQLVGPMLERQQSFNAALVQHLAQRAAADRELSSIVVTSVTVLRDELEALATFKSQLAQYLQQITPFVDTRMRVLEHAMDELGMSAAAAQRASSAVKRELTRLVGDGWPVPPAGAGGTSAALAPLDASKYVGFEDCFRGTPEAVGARLADYARYFEGASDVLDIGCGRGEFLDVLKARGVRARGIDANPDMVEVGRARGLDVQQADALAYLSAQPDESLGGLLAAQVVEHLEPSYLVRLLEIAHHKLRPGAFLVVETINAACWVAFFESYIRDITHVRPLHPDTLKYLVVASGFHDVDVQFRSPIEEAGKLERLSAPVAAGAGGVDAAGLRAITDVTRAFNANVDRLNERLFTYLDYAIVARR